MLVLLQLPLGRHDFHFLAVRRLRRDRICGLLPADAAGRSGPAATTREIVHAAFPDSKRWLSVEVNRSELRWADGVHLDERSAVIVTQAMERALAPARAMR